MYLKNYCSSNIEQAMNFERFLQLQQHILGYNGNFCNLEMEYLNEFKIFILFEIKILKISTFSKK